MKDRDARLDDKTLIINDIEMERLRKLNDDHQASLIVLAGWEIGRQIELHEPETILGRSITVGVRVDNRSVSRQHAKIVRHLSESEDYYEVLDLGSVNGIRVNNQPVQSAQLQDGDKIQLGDVVFKFSLSDAMESQFH
jgi:pSer/pThr/pTyr-binding forkhead associated (FHA) protein